MKIFKIGAFLCCFIAVIRLHAQPLHEYFFNGNLNGTAGGPTLTQNLACAAAAGSFGTQTVTTTSGTCAIANAFCFNQGGGLNYPNPNYITNQYTIHLFFKFNVIGGWSRIIDFSNSANDAGIYWLTDCLNFYPNGNVGTCPYFLANVYYLMSFVRDGTTNIISAYVNGTLFGTYNDATNVYRPATSNTPIIFFRDDNTVPCEAKPGCVKYMSITSGTSTAAQIATTWTNICSIALPVELSKFEAIGKGDEVEVNWNTETESNSKLFEIERSIDAVTFVKIGEKNAAGESYSQRSYKFTDQRPEQGKNYYRLKQIDKDGTFKHSPIAVVEPGSDNISFSPNPAEDYVYIKSPKKDQKICLINLLGIDVLSLDAIPENGRVNLSDIPNGMYFILAGDSRHNLIIKH